MSLLEPTSQRQASFHNVSKSRVSSADTDEAAATNLAIPMHPNLTEEQVKDWIL